MKLGEYRVEEDRRGGGGGEGVESSVKFYSAEQLKG